VSLASSNQGWSTVARCCRAVGPLSAYSIRDCRLRSYPSDCLLSSHRLMLRSTDGRPGGKTSDEAQDHALHRKRLPRSRIPPRHFTFPACRLPLSVLVAISHPLPVSAVGNLSGHEQMGILQDRKGTQGSDKWVSRIYLISTVRRSCA
jgi:hypothetical protein